MSRIISFMHIIQKITVLILLCLSGVQLSAAHLVGGDISYECLGNNKYQIRLRVYRDCANNGAQFDEFVSIAIYNDGTDLLRQLSISGTGRTQVPDSVGNPCVTPPPGLCTEYLDYIDTVTLPPRQGGYVLTWQRCCRNGIIENIGMPQSQGSTYTVQIPSNDTTCNSSPFILNVPPIVLCMGQPLAVPVEVRDLDGDSLYFELCEILRGGNVAGDPNSCSLDRTIPIPPCPPPYREIPFLAPYTSTNPLPALPAFTIDTQTGILSGTPNMVGTYVVGICISDYRQGRRQSTVRLDYQFNVTQCIKTVVSDMVTPIEDPTILCDGLTVRFTSEGTSPDVLWDFGVPGATGDTSTAQKPTFTFPGAGPYRVTLIADPGSPCGDTTEYVFNVTEPNLPDFFWTGRTCFEAQEVDIRPLTGFPPGTSYLWEFDSTAAFPVYTQRDPPIQSWSVPGKHYISLTVNVGPCEYTKRDSIEISYLSANVDAGPDQTVSVGKWATLRASGGKEYYWYADTEVELSSRITAITRARMEEVDTVKFYVRAIDEYGCEGLDSAWVYVLSGEAVGPINFFSPNGDGRNDVFDLKDINPDNEFSLIIYNRWGSEIWSVQRYQNDWEGVDYGLNALPDGTYYYILHNDGEVIYKSAITLIRNPLDGP
ncbi:MAG: gliding motility-associated C-terminal domain-containing protein [Owenweeksia sp.]